MSLSLVVSMSISLDTETGMPYVCLLKNDTVSHVNFQYEDFKIPEIYLPYVEQDGYQFYSYIARFDNGVKEARVDEFLYLYPAWEDVKRQNYYTDDDNGEWTKKNHEEFEDFLKWMTKRAFTCPYIISWID